MLSALDLLGGAALLVQGAIFLGVRGVRGYLSASVVLVLAVATSVIGFPAFRTIEGGTLAAGVALLAAGLLFIRLMLARSVSLHLLEHLEDRELTFFRQEIAERFADMRKFGLIRSVGDRPTLTWFGRCIGRLVAFSYGAVGIER